MGFQILAQALVSLFTTTLILVNLCSISCSGQDTESTLQEHLKYGEYSKAIELAEESTDGNHWLAVISTEQAAAGADQAAQQSLQKITLDKVRFRALAQQQLFGGGPIGAGPIFGGPGQRQVNGNGNNSVVQNGQRGGITAADFVPLINLIRSTVDPDSWDDANGDGTIQSYPAGVYADSTGTLRKIKVDKNRSLRKLAKNATQKSRQVSIRRPSQLRKVSLNRLERHAQLLAANGKTIPDAMQNLAGIYEIEYLMLLPETNDIVIAGPAGDWRLEADGHAVNVESGKPVLQLDDLVVCLRNAQPAPHGNFGKFGCSITPRKKNLAATKEFVSTSKLRGTAWRNQLRDVLGQQDIEVFGIDPATHAGMVLIEADYRMKLVAMGLEPSIPEIQSYLSRLAVGPDGEVEPMDVVRWWFTMNYDHIVSDEDRRVFELNGTGVKVLSENEFISEQGDRVHTGKSDGPTAGFARDFTKHFDAIADQHPIYRRLKNLFDLSIVSALIQSHGLARRADWNFTFFGNSPDYSALSYQVATQAVPTQVNSVMNHRIIKRRKQSSTVKHTLVGVSGGITFDAIEVIRTKAETPNDNTELFRQVSDAKIGVESLNWWWD